jgi:hypothetical protein
MLKLYSIYHLNMMFSSIEEDDRRAIVDRCYWPLLSLSDDGYKLGIELTGHTLELINSIDHQWVEKFKSLLSQGKVELIGSGYSQIIGPLVPAEVNEWNQQLGLDIYKNILGVRPAIALVNEMAYSSGLVEHYLNNGYKAIIMEWNNPRKYHPEWDNGLRYHAQKTVNQQGDSINLIWADSIAFQKFQRYAHAEVSLTELMTYLASHKNVDERFFPLYTSDAEVFDYRPGRFKTEAILTHKTAEWDRIEMLVKALNESDGYEFALPSEVIQYAGHSSSGHELSLEATEHPIPVKKQAKYNITRWAVTGRNDLWLNTICYRIFSEVKKYDDRELWKTLCNLWGSDFRTHITSMRWGLLLTEIGQLVKELNIDLRDQNNKKQFNNSNEYFQGHEKYEILSNSVLEVSLNTYKGCTIHSYKPHGQEYPLLGTLDHGYFDDIEYGVDYFSGHAVIEKLGSHKITDISAGETHIWKENELNEIWLELTREDVGFQKGVVLENNSLWLSNTISFSSKKKEIIHPFHFTLIPEAWDFSSLYYATHNGGNELEVFPIEGKDFHHGDNHSFLISSRHGLGNTNGVIVIGDRYQSIEFSIDLNQAFLIPSVFIQKISNLKFLFRLVYSAQEVDETSRTDSKYYSIQSAVSIRYSVK